MVFERNASVGSASDKVPVIVVCGPTATGKSELAQCIAQQVDGCVLSADSMQVYRGMDIGTAKLKPSERRVEHFGLDLVEPDEAYSAALYQRYARDMIAQSEARKRPVVMAGGTGLYIQAALDDLDFPKGDQAENPIRQHYMHIAEESGPQSVWEALYKLDEKSAQAIHPHNVKRVIRALEMHYAGISYADRAHGMTHVSPFVPAIRIGLTLERPLLYSRIDTRVDRMQEQGLIEEVEGLAQAGFTESLTARQAIGYKEVLDALAGSCTMEEAFDSIKRASRRYAKRQMTWFKRDERIYWIDITGKGEDEVRDEACAYLSKRFEGFGEQHEVGFL